jgi:hypothetical protein
MKTPKQIAAFTAICLSLFLVATPAAFGGGGGVGAPWYADQQFFGKTEYDGKLYVIFQDTGRKSIPGGVGNPAGDAYREYVVEIQFILELTPSKGKAGPLYFSGIGKTCEASSTDPSFPVCAPGEDSYNDWFYLPGDYVGRIGAALRSFLEETVYPVLCAEDPNCEGFLTEAIFTDGSGNADAVVDLTADLPPKPWYWVQPITIVTP